jgi:hypothetical protein
MDANCVVVNPRTSQCRGMRGSRRSFPMAVLLIAWLSASTALPGWAQETCVPVGTGGAYNNLSGGAPKFWDTTPTTFSACNDNSFDRFNKWIDDPRWDGATSTTQGPGTTEILQFRAVQRPVGGANYLFLSWWIKNTAVLSTPTHNQLYVGFRPDDTTSASIVLLVELGQSNVAVGESAVQGAADTTLYVQTSPTLPTNTTGPTNIYHGSTGSQALPSWAQDARVWISQSRITPGVASGCAPGPAVVWAVHLRVPLQTNISPSATLPVTLGSTPQRKFRIWYSTRYDTPAGIVPLTWPTGGGSFDVQQPAPDFTDATPPFSAWLPFYLSTGSTDTTASCTSGGIAIEPSDITVTYPTSPDDWHIGIPLTSTSTPPTNTFHAKPTNKASPAAVNRSDLHARFRIANWGSTIQDGDAIPGTGDWTDIAGLGDVTDDGTTGTPDPVPNGSKWDIHKDKQFAFNDFVGKSNHQCVAVDLSGSGTSGLSFLSASAFRNLHTVRLSTLREDAEIALTGLKGGAVRDVYLYVEAHNMPAVDFSDRGKPQQPTSSTSAANAAKGGRASQGKNPTEDAEASIQSPEYERRAATDPTYIIRSFYDTGRKTRINGQDLAVLQPMVSFGYFAEHQGDLAGWRHELEGAEKISDNWYRLHVNGKAKITNTLEAVEPKTFGVGLHVGVTSPQSNFSNSYGMDPSYGLDLEYRFTNAYTLIGTIARDEFKPKTGAPDLNATRITLGARGYMLSGATRPFWEVSAGSYGFSPGQTRGGGNVGVGVQQNFSPIFALELALKYHSVSNNSPNSSYATIDLGLRYRF